MQFCKKFKLYFCLIVLGGNLGMLLPNSAWAGSQNLSIRNAQLSTIAENYLLTMQVDAKFNEEINQALLKGFELHFIIEFQLASPRKYWFDDEITTISQEISISYHPLSRQYLWVQGETKKSLVSLNEVAAEFLHLQPIKVFSQSDLEKDKSYKALALVRLDYRNLPKMIQEVVVDSAAWKMTSQRYEWVPTLNK